MPSTALLRQAATQARLSNTRIDIYRLPDGIHVIVPHGYDVPTDKMIFVGYVGRDGNFIDATDTESSSSTTS